MSNPTLNLTHEYLAGTASYYADGNGGHPVSFLYAQDINHDGLDEVFFAAFESQPSTPATYDNTSIVIFGWRDGIFQNITEDWLPGNLSQVQGVGDISFGDFDGNGHIDVFLSAYTDMVHPAQRYALMNSGNSFERIDLGTALWDHASYSADINGDGYDDVILTGYNLRSNFIGSPDGLVRVNSGINGSGLALGDYLGDGTITAVYSDSSQALAQLFSIDIIDNQVIHTWISDLPQPRIDLNSHDIRVRNIDFNSDGLLDILVFSWQFPPPDWSVIQSEIQFLKNLGNGQFSDVTDQVLINYDHLGNVGYFPQILDVNQDGLLDIFTSNRDWLDSYRSTSLLIQQTNGTFIATGSEALRNVIGTGAQAVLARGPGGAYYLVTEKAWDFSQVGFSVTTHEINFSIEIRNTITGTSSANKLIGTTGHDDIYGLAGNDTLTDLLGGNDYLDGGVGADSMTGGTGDDTYIVDNSKDKVTEKSNQGTDEVRSEITYTLGSYLENLTLMGSSNINGTGNTLANIISGNSGNNTLNGGSGADALIGDEGNDIYVIDNIGDSVTEFNEEGTDLIQSSVSVSGLLADDASCAYIGSYVENITLTGSGNVNASGNALSNSLLGNQKTNTLKGLDGNDVLNGNLGNDLLWGGSGSDTFIFNSKLGSTNKDTIYDFNVTDDSIHLENSIFKKLTIAGTLSNDNFWIVGSRAQDANDFITFNSSTGALSYDSDGSGRIAAIQFATIDLIGLTGTLTAADFLVI